MKKAEKTLPCGQATKGIDCRPCSAVSLGINRVQVMQMGGRSPYPGSFRTLHSCQLLIRKASGSVSRGPGVSKSVLLTFGAKVAVVLVEWHCQTLGGPGMFHCKPQKPWQLKDGTRPTYKCALSSVDLPEFLCHQHALAPPSFWLPSPLALSTGSHWTSNVMHDIL